MAVSTQLRGAIVAAFLALAAAGCGGGGGGGSSGPLPPSRFFAVDAAHLAIGSLVNPDPSPGAIAVDRIITGSSTGLTASAGRLALDTVNDRLYVANGTSILVFEK